MINLQIGDVIRKDNTAMTITGITVSIDDAQTSLVIERLPTTVSFDFKWIDIDGQTKNTQHSLEAMKILIVDRGWEVVSLTQIKAKWEK